MEEEKDKEMSAIGKKIKEENRIEGRGEESLAQKRERGLAYGSCSL